MLQLGYASKLINLLDSVDSFWMTLIMSEFCLQVLL